MRAMQVFLGKEKVLTIMCSWFPEGVVQYTNDTEKWVFE